MYSVSPTSSRSPRKAPRASSFPVVRGRNDARRWPGVVFSALLLLSACTTPQTARLLDTAPAFPQPVELREVPFFPQEAYQCGPAALATVLNWSGLSVTPEQLAPQVYIPEREGSLQFELLAAARRHGRVPYVLRPQLESLMTEVASGNPVIVLQNLSLAISPKWHYAVVVGFDLAQAEITLRSGDRKRHVVPMELFERTWRRGDYWAFVALPADKLPQTAEETPYLQSVVALEKLGRYEEAAVAYSTALKRWPRSLGAHLGLGNSLYARGDRAGAERAFRDTVRDHPQVAAAHNNLAQVLADAGKWEEAEAEARRAIELGGPQKEIFEKTLARIQARVKD